MTYTKEPWHIGLNGTSIYDEFGWGIASITDIPSRRGVKEIKANARRIVACVNACAGLSTENLEDNISLKDGLHELNSRVREVEQQRDLLLAALERIADWPREYEVCDVAREAINLVRGGAV